MSFDPFIFTPPAFDDINVAVEWAQKDLANRAFRYARGSERPSSAEIAGAARNARHLTAIHRTLRKVGGPLFDPESPLTPAKRYDLLCRRLEQVEFLRDRADGAPPLPLRCDSRSRAEAPPLGAELARRSLDGGGSACSASSDAQASSADLSAEASAKEEAFPEAGSAFASLHPDYEPPDIEDLCDAASLLAKVSATRWREMHDDRRCACSDDRQLETLALRDLTAVFRTLHRMSAVALAEDQTHDDLQREFNQVESYPDPTDSYSSHPSDSSHASPASDDALPLEPADPHASHPSDALSSSCPSCESSSRSSSTASSSSSESVPSVNSVDASSSPADEERPISTENPLPLQRPVHAIPPVPEIRPVSASRRADRHPPASPSNGGSRRSSRKSRGRWADLYQEEDSGPWGIWDTPPPDAIDESSPEFLADMKRYGYVQAHRRARARLQAAAGFASQSSPILNDSDPPPD